jgi:hypothetical protein
MKRFCLLLALAGLVLAAPAAQARTLLPESVPVRLVAPERLAVRGVFSLPQGHTETAILASEEEAPADPLTSAAGTTTLALPAGGEARLAGLARSPLLTFDILLLTQRQNE